MTALTAEELSAIDAARAFVARHAATNVQAWDRGDADTRAVLPEAARAGLLSLEVPVEQGGQGLSFGCKWRVAEILAAVDFGLAMSVINTHNVANHLSRAAVPAVARRYLPALLAGERTGCTALTEPGAGSDFAAITTRARRVGDDWVIDGQKSWIVNATHADVVVVYAQTDPAGGARGIAAFVVDGTRAGFLRHPRADSAASRGHRCGGLRASGLPRAGRRTAAPAGPGLQGRAGVDQRRQGLRRLNVLRHGG